MHAGHETKIFKNSSEAPSKRSSVERIVDKVCGAGEGGLCKWGAACCNPCSLTVMAQSLTGIPSLSLSHGDCAPARTLLHLLSRCCVQVIIFMFTLLFCMCITGCVYFALWVKDHYEDAWYLGSFKTNVQYNPDKPVAAAFTNFITVFILYGRCSRLAASCWPGVLVYMAWL